MITKFVKYWVFDERERPHTELVSLGKIRLNAEDSIKTFIQLKAEDGTYSTDDDLRILTRTITPNTLLQWLKAELVWGTTEEDFKEYPITLSNKVGADYDYFSSFGTPKIGDKIYQADSYATITGHSGSKITVDTPANLVNGQCLAIRSKCQVNIHLVDISDNIWYWNTTSSTWEIGVTSNWNTIFQVNNHLSELPLNTFGKGVRLEVNLKTEDEKHTPYVEEVKFLAEVDIEFMEDIIYDTIIPMLKRELQVTAQINIQLQADTDQIDLVNDYPLEDKGYNFTDVQRAYNYTADPLRLVNIATGYTKGAPREGGGFDHGIIHLDGVKSAGSIIEVKLLYFPEISVNTDVDFYEVNRTPSIVFENIRKESIRDDGARQKDFVKDKLNLSGVRMRPPATDHLIFEYAVFTGSQTDQQRLGEALHRFFQRFRHITSWGLDIPYAISTKDVFRSENKANTSNVNTHMGSFMVHRMLSYLEEPEDVSLVGNFQRSMTTN